jgi:hypothetical protein
MQDDSKLLSLFLSISHGNPDNSLESLCITKLCRQKVTQNHENEYVRGRGHGEARNIKYKTLKLAGGQA